MLSFDLTKSYFLLQPAQSPSQQEQYLPLRICRIFLYIT